MAIAATATWEVRTTGSDNNGGGYNPARSVDGVDRSQQDAEHVFIDGSTITATVHTTTTQITISGYSVGNADLGNHLNITGGTATAGVYEITAVDTGNNRWTLDRSAGTSTQTVIGRMGGAFATIAAPHAILPNNGTSARSAWNTVWVRHGTYDISTEISLRGDYCMTRGYHTTRGDDPTGSNRPTIRATASIASCCGFTRTDTKLINFIVDANELATSAVRQVSGRPILHNCELKNALSHGAVVSGGSVITLCDIHDNGGIGINNADKVIGCRVYNNGDIGIYAANGSGVISMNIIYNNSGDGVSLQDACAIINNTIHGNSGNGVLCRQSSNMYLLVINNLITSNGGYGISASAHNSTMPSIFNVLQNAHHNNTSGHENGFTSVSSVTLTEDPYINAPGGDFRLNDAAGGGQLVKNAGIPETLNGYDVNINIGAYENVDTGGGGGSRFPVIWGGGF